MKFLEEIIYVLVAFLIIVWPMDHMIAVRNIDIGLIFVLSIINYFYSKHRFSFSFEKKEKYLILLIGIFFMLMFIISFFSPFYPKTFLEIKAQFWGPFLLSISGYFIIKSNIDYKKLFVIIFISYFIFVAYHFLYSLNYYIKYHKIPMRSFVLTKGLDELNLLMTYIFAFFAVEFIFRIIRKKTILNISNLHLFILFGIAVFSLILQFKRNGVFSMLFLGISIVFFVLLMLKNNKLSKTYLLPIIVIAGLITSLAFYDFKNDKRWNRLYRTYNLVFVKNDMTWYQKKIPHGYFSSNYRIKL